MQRQSGKLREISQMAERFGCTPSQLAIAWSLRNEHVHSVLIGAVSPEQLYEHLQALQVKRLALLTALIAEVVVHSFFICSTFAFETWCNGRTLYTHALSNLPCLQIVPKLSGAIMLDLERVLDNKPVRPPMISTLAMR